MPGTFAFWYKLRQAHFSTAQKVWRERERHTHTHSSEHSGWQFYKDEDKWKFAQESLITLPFGENRSRSNTVMHRTSCSRLLTMKLICGETNNREKMFISERPELSCIKRRKKRHDSSQKDSVLRKATGPHRLQHILVSVTWSKRSPPGWDASPSQVYNPPPPPSSHSCQAALTIDWYPFIPLAGEMTVKCPRTQHGDLELTPLGQSNHYTAAPPNV